tara:strand:- start:1153 stop:1446 length:294 start_codon:yes stop_codon:yes gene_type:complete
VTPMNEDKTKDLNKILDMAKINLTDEEEEDFYKEFEKIIDYFNHVKKVNTDNIDEFIQDFRVDNIGREDKVKSFPSEDILKNISKKKGRFIKAPRIV